VEAPPFEWEAPQHRVTIAKPFAVGRYAVSFAEWDAAQKDKDWHAVSGLSAREPKDYGWGRGDRPVADVSWDDAKAYAKWLSGKMGKDYRLLSEAEWEYACRAGTRMPFWWGSPISTEQANCNGNYTFGGGKKGQYRQGTVPVKSFRPNPWGLYQVHGNVWEWCEDFRNDSYDGAPSDGSAWIPGDRGGRVLRGGSWFDFPHLLRAAGRNGGNPVLRGSGIGFRLARTITS
jgi:formylglycine-generating enzyme required for sulfatase activity